MSKPLFCLLFFLTSVVQAQVTIQSERDKDNNVHLYATNMAEIPYSVFLNFSNLQNMTTSGGGNTVAVANRGRSKVATLRPTLAGQSTDFRYTYSFAKGNVYAKSKTLPAYLLPVPEGVSVKGVKNNPLEEAIGQENQGGTYRGVTFYFEAGTALLAPRKGIVSALKTDVEAKGKNLSYVADENFLELYHEDGTFTMFTILKAGTEKVELGQQVFPGDTLALSAGENYVQGPHVRILHLKTVVEKDKFMYLTFPVSYLSMEGTQEINEYITLVSAHPQELITLEMNKKELKGYLEGKKE